MNYYKMPRKAIDYAKNFNYKIVCKDLSITDSYAGSSTNWPKRKNSHKTKCHNEKAKNYHYKVYAFIRAHGGWKNWNMILIEYFPCKTQPESAQRERYWTEKIKATLNCNVQGRTNKEYKADHKEQIAEYGVEYRANHKEQKAERDAKYQADHKEQISARKAVLYTCICGSICTTGNKSQHEKSKKHCSYMTTHPVVQDEEVNVNMVL
jgi:hypothetical protein